MNQKIKSGDLDYLFKAILSLKTLDECYGFFEDICTVNELLSISQRISVAKCLSIGETQSEIKRKTGASSATISRVNRTLLYGNDAYNMVFQRIDDTKEKL